MRKLLFFFGILLFIFSCNEKTGAKKEAIVSRDTLTPVITPAINERTKINFTEPGQKIIVASNRISPVTGKKGIKFIVDPSAFETINGSPIGDKIEIDLKEITNQEELFKNDAPTSSAGRLLVSGGAYYIGMLSNGNQLKLKKGRSLSIEIPKISANEMELFYGERDDNGILNWVAAGKKINSEKIIAREITLAVIEPKNTADLPAPKGDTVRKETGLETLLNYADKKGNRLSMEEFDSLLNVKRVNEDNPEYSRRVSVITDTLTGKKTIEVKTTYYRPLEITNLGWINCDRFFNMPGSEIRCEFDSSLDITSVVVYVVFKDLNAMQKEYMEPVHDASFTRLRNQYPQGQHVRFIAFTNVNGKYYESKQDVMLQKSQLVKFTFSAVSDMALMKKSYQFSRPAN